MTRSDPATGADPVTDTTGARDANPEIRALLRLHGLPGVGDTTVARLVRSFGSASSAWTAPYRAFIELAGRKAAEARSAGGGEPEVDEALRRARALGVRVVGLGTPGYPAGLDALHDPPPVLFLRGRAEILERPTVAVVGSRRATAYGRRSAEVLGAALAREGIVVASGLALGVDAAAHRGALQADGEALGVLGSGVDVPYPRTNSALFERLARDHLLVSEFLPGTTAAPHHFPQRNRVMAALSSAVVVVEAAERSGALITVDHALDLGREVLAVPGKVDSPTSRGTNALIRDGGTILCDLREVGDVLAMALPTVFGAGGAAGALDGDRRADGRRRSGSARGPDGLSPETARVWEALGAEPRSVDEVARATQLGSSRILAALSGLEADGWAEALPGMRYARADGCEPAADRGRGGP